MATPESLMFLNNGEVVHVLDVHGGNREGAGAKPIYAEPMSQRSVSVPDYMWQKCKDMGEGDGASAGFRAIITEWMAMKNNSHLSITRNKEPIFFSGKHGAWGTEAPTHKLDIAQS